MRCRLVTLLLLCSFGCLVLPVPTHENVIQGQRSTTLDVSFIQKHKTLRPEIFDKLGAPTIWLPTQRIAVYGATFVRSHLFVAVAYAGGFTVPITEREALFIAFDESDRAILWRVGEADIHRTWVGASIHWAKSVGLTVKEPRVDFITREAPANRSLVYFYCIKHVKIIGDPWPGILLNGALLGQVRKKTYLPVELDAGKYTFTIDPLYSSTSKLPSRPAIFELELKPGETSYLEFHIETGFNKDFSVVFHQHSKEEALPVIRGLRETW